MINSANELNYNYAYALILLANEQKDLEKCLEIFSDFVDLLNNDKEILPFLESYFVQLIDKYLFIDEILSSVKRTYFTSFLKLLIKKHLIKNIEQIYR